MNAPQLVPPLGCRSGLWDRRRVDDPDQAAAARLRRGGGQRLPDQERQPVAAPAQALKQCDIGKIGKPDRRRPGGSRSQPSIAEAIGQDQAQQIHRGCDRPRPQKGLRVAGALLRASSPRRAGRRRPPNPGSQVIRESSHGGITSDSLDTRANVSAYGTCIPGGRLLVDASGNLFGTTRRAALMGPARCSNSRKRALATRPRQPSSPASPQASFPLARATSSKTRRATFSAPPPATVFEVQKTGAPAMLAPVNLVTLPGRNTDRQSNHRLRMATSSGQPISGGANDDGSVFEIEKTAGGYATTPTSSKLQPRRDGEFTLNHPKTLIVDTNGDIFGTTDPSSQNSGGVVFEIVKTAGGYNPTPTIVVNFNGPQTSAGLGANLVADANGNLFGTTQTGGANNSGTAFEITNSGFVVPPVLTAGAAASYVAAAPAVALDPGLSVTGADPNGSHSEHQRRSPFQAIR